jgi:hypothetical protein
VFFSAIGDCPQGVKKRAEERRGEYGGRTTNEGREWRLHFSILASVTLEELKLGKELDVSTSSTPTVFFATDTWPTT